jgi:hypothetical protein
MRPAFRYPVWGLAAALICLSAVLFGCSSVATRRGFYDPITADVRARNYDSAVVKLEAARESNKFTDKDRLLYYLDAGLAHHYAGNYRASNEKLHQAEDAAEELFTKSISRAAASVMLNDNVLEYAGEDYEILYANLIKALNYLALDEFDEAFVEVRRANEKLAHLEDKYAAAARQYQQGAEDDTTKTGIVYEPKHVRFYNDAFARYLSMHLYAADGKYDDARIDYDFLVEAFANQPYVYSFGQPEVVYRSDDQTILSVVALAGLGPRKEAFNLRLRTDKDLGLVQVLYTDSDGREAEYGHLPLPVKADYYFKFAIPRVEARPSVIGRIRLLVNGEEIGELQLLEDVAAVAEETFEAKKTLIYLRSLARAVAKGLANHKMKKRADTGGIEGWLKKAAIDVATDISENADLRSAQLLPGFIYVGDFELKPGTYNLTVEFLSTDGHLISSELFTDYPVTRRGLNMIEAISPR